jgi:isochorismate hydrolase
MAKDQRRRNRENMRQRRAANPEFYRQQNRAWRAANPEKARAAVFRWQHSGFTRADKAKMLDDQQGCCYLCGDELTLENAVIDHDHRCCPLGRSCQYCRRGLACNPCNSIIGYVLEDAARLRRIADSMEIAFAETARRLEEKPRQLSLINDEEVA